MLRHQVNEIEAARFQPDEETQVEQDYQRASNAAKLLQLSQTALDLLGENESSLLTQAGIVGRALQELQRVDACATPLTELHEQASAPLRDFQAGPSPLPDHGGIHPPAL